MFVGVYGVSSLTLSATSIPSSEWTGVCVSSNGSKIIAVSAYPYTIYSSNDYGYNWVPAVNQTSGGFQSVACSSNGQIAYAGQGMTDNNYLWSSFDGGISWSIVANSPPSYLWYSIATSESGEFVFACSSLNSIWVSSNYGENWSSQFTYSSTSSVLFSIACSGNGTYVYAVVWGSGIFSSVDRGQYFNQTLQLSRNWTAISSDSSGRFVAAAAVNAIYTSSDYGNTFILTAAPYISWTAITSDSTGRYLFAVASVGSYYSTDYGQIWIAITSANNNYWTSVACSSTGQYVTASYTNGYYTDGVFTTFFNPTSQPSSTPSLSPTTRPSTNPSSQPSGYPTYGSIVDMNYTGVSTSFVDAYKFTNLGIGHSTLYLSVLLRVSYLNFDSKGYVNISAGSGVNIVNVSTKCTPKDTCGPAECAVNIEVSKALSSVDGGSIEVLAQVVNAKLQTGIDTDCTYLGAKNLFTVYYRLTSYPLVTRMPTGIPTMRPTEGGFVLEIAPDLPFYVIAGITLCFATVGLFVVRVNDLNNRWGNGLLITCFAFAMSGYRFSTEIFYLVVLFSDNMTFCGAAIISIRLCSSILALIFCFITLGPNSASRLYAPLLNRKIMANNSFLYSVVVMMLFIDHTLIRYFPWTSSEYLKLTGFPNRLLIMMSMIPYLFQLLFSLCVQGYVLVVRNSYSDLIALTLVVLYLASSILSFILFALTVFLRLKLDDEQSGPKPIDAEIGDIKPQNPIFACEHVGCGTELTLRTSNAILDSNGLARMQYLEERERLLSNKVYEDHVLIEELLSAVSDLKAELVMKDGCGVMISRAANN